MAAIPTEVIFVLIFIAFSILEGVGRKRKTQQKGAPGKAPSPGPRPAPRPSREPAETGAPVPDRGSVSRAEGAGQGSSEGLIPKDVWEEILGLARGTAPAPRQADPAPDLPEPRPRREDETLEEIHPFEARTLEPVDFEDERQVSRPERLPVPAGTSPTKGLAARKGSGLKRSGAKAVAAAKARMPGSAEPSGKRSVGTGVRADLLGDGSPENLKKAIILREVLGPPLGLRE
jgi:hypothetical protein